MPAVKYPAVCALSRRSNTRSILGRVENAFPQERPERLRSLVPSLERLPARQTEHGDDALEGRQPRTALTVPQARCSGMMDTHPLSELFVGDFDPLLPMARLAQANINRLGLRSARSDWPIRSAA